jgi:hypothetical protein
MAVACVETLSKADVSSHLSCQHNIDANRCYDAGNSKEKGIAVLNCGEFYSLISDVP